VHTRNEDYWAEPAHIERVEVFGITDTTARLNAILTGDVHMIVTVDPKAIPQLEASDNAYLLSTPSNQWNGICCMKNQHPGENDDFVLGMKYLPRRERIVKALLKGHGVVGNDHPIGLSNRYHATAEELPQRKYDVDKAKFHLKKAGLSSLKVDLSAADAANGRLVFQQTCSACHTLYGEGGTLGPDITGANRTNLDYLLRNLGVRHLIITGCLTDQCVESAVRDACDLGYLMTLVTDGCATLSPERQENSLRTIKGYCRQRDSAELLAEIAEQHA